MRVAIVGATGAVGHELLRVLEKSTLKLDELHLYASSRSEGIVLDFAGQQLPVRATPQGAIPADLILASAGSCVSKALASTWVAAGSVVIDNSSAFRYDANVPLVVPEVNGAAALRHQGIIANPNCTTAIAMVAVAPLYKAFGIQRMIVSTYQSASGAGQKGIEELLEGTCALLTNEQPQASVFAHPLPFNVLPHIDSFQDNGYTKEEMKVVWETRKILENPSLRISCTAVRIPTLRAHSEAITLQLQRSATPAQARAVLQQASGVELRDYPSASLYPMPLTASGKYDVEVGRIRQSLVFENGLDLFVVGDQLLKGAALNAVQIAEYLQLYGAL